MHTKVSQLVSGQLPQYIQDESPQFVKFLEYYYKSQEKTGLSQNILANLLEYANIDSFDISLIQGRTQVLKSVSKTDSIIVAESVEGFLPENGSFLLDKEVVYYEKTTRSPQVSLIPGISYAEFQTKYQYLVSPFRDFDGITSIFEVKTESSLVVPPTVNHLIVNVYGEYLVPNEDYTLDTSEITFASPPRSRQANDSIEDTQIIYLKGFFQDTIKVLSDISSQFNGSKKTFSLKEGLVEYKPILTEYTVVILNNQLLIPKEDYNINEDSIIFKVAPSATSKCHIRSIEAPILSYGSGAAGVAQISEDGAITGIKVKSGGSDYKLEYPPQVRIVEGNGNGAVARSLVNGLKTIQLLDGGKGYSKINPPVVLIEPPTDESGEAATAIATVNDNGSVDSLTLTSSGSRYTFVPRISFGIPGGATLTQPNINSEGQIIESSVQIDNPGQYYSVAPSVYVDEPTGNLPITAIITTTIDEQGRVNGVNIVHPGRGYSQENPPRIRIIDDAQAQVLEVNVDAAGRVIDIEVLNGGTGFDDVPSVYIIDDRIDTITNQPIGGTGAKATVTIFNGSITDINVIAFGSGYSSTNPPKVIIQRPRSAKASSTVGFSEVTGFKILESGSGYTQARFEGCVRGVSGLVEYDATGNAIFENSTIAAAHPITATTIPQISSLDGLFIQKMLAKFAEQYLPNVPAFDYTQIDIITVIKNIRKFYASKGTKDSTSFMFKLLYGEDIEINYPKDQIIQPSAATWTIDTVLRCEIISGDPRNITDGVLTQDADPVDTTVVAASALIENFLAIKTSTTEIYELILSEESITGEFSIPYKTLLCERISGRDTIITVDSTVGWPERNGVFVINGTEKVRYKEKSLNQFIECTRGIDGTESRNWDPATTITSDTFAYINKGTSTEVKIKIVGIVEAEGTTLTDDGSYYLSGDKLTVAKLGSSEDIPQLQSWIYNVKKLVQIESIEIGGDANRTATVTCTNPHGLLVGDQVTVYGANPVVYNGTFLVQSREDEFVFKYQIPVSQTNGPQGNILISVDLNKGKSEVSSISNIISQYTSNVQNTFFNNEYIYVASTGIPNYKVGPFAETALIPGNQRKLYRFPKTPNTISTKDAISYGPIGSWVNGVTIWAYQDKETKLFGAVTDVSIVNPGQGYDASSPPVLTITNGGGTGATGYVVVDGSVTEIEVLNEGSGYTSSPLVSIVGGGGEGASATAVVTKGKVTQILVNSGGTGFTSRPDITIVGGGGTGATARASVRGPIKDIVIDEGGSNYTEKPDVILSSGAGAAAQAIVNDGRIISIAIIAAGNGYTTPPSVKIYGEGFGAVARANIDTDGESAGRVTSIDILNKGIGYKQGTTIIELNSVGSGAVFDSQVFEWRYNLQTNSDFDTAYGAVFQGYNTQYGGEYAHISNPQRLRYVLGDNMILDAQNNIREQEGSLEHSPILGWAFDGNPIYGPYGYDDPTNLSSAIRRMESSYALVPNLVYDADINPIPARIDGPSLVEYAAGAFVEDYRFNFGTGDLDQYNGRFCKTPEFPNGTYCYFVTIDASEAGNAVFPYVIGPSWNSVVDKWNLNQAAVQQNIPSGIVRYRDPFENVDIDVVREPNSELDSITFEDGDFIRLEIEDLNKDSVLDDEEISTLNTLEEESQLELYDYFPTVKFDSRVDIEVETTSKFEDAKITGFIIENPGNSYQVNDILVFDNTDTDGYGVSARISKIVGKTVSSYTYQIIDDKPYGVITTETPHELKVGDKIYVSYEPIVENTSKKFPVAVVRGIEELNITQVGTGYTSDVPITVEIDGTGKDAIIEPKVDKTTGNITGFEIINSGNGFVTNPRILVSHPQIFKKADYYLNLAEGVNEQTVIHNVVTTSTKDTYAVGKTKDIAGNWQGFVSKYNQNGLLVWQKTLRSNSPNLTGDSYCELSEIYVDEFDDNRVIVCGHTKPNGINPAHNPDIIVARYNQNNTGLSATLAWQREYAGISGISRGDYVTSLTKLTTDRYVLGGYTDTNTSSSYDGFLIVINELGNFVAKRKFTSTTGSEKVVSVVVHNEEDGANIDRIYYLMEVAPSNTSQDKSLVLGKAQLTQFGLVSNELHRIANAGFAFNNARMTIDEFNEVWISAQTINKTNLEAKSIWVGKFNLDCTNIWNYRYTCGGALIDSVNVVGGTVDLFNHLNLGLEVVRASDKKVINHFVKISYNGEVETDYAIDYNSGIEGLDVYASTSDVSGDHVIVGQAKHNRTVALFDFEPLPNTIEIAFIDKTEKITNVEWVGDNDVSIGRGSQTSVDVIGYDISAGSFSPAYLKVFKANSNDLVGYNNFLNDDWTVSGFFNPSSTYVTNGYTGETPVLFQFGSRDGSGIAVIWDRVGQVGSANSILLYASATNLGTSTPIISTGNVIDVNQWNYIHLTKDGTTYTLFVDGTEVCQATAPGITLGNFWVANAPTSGTTFSQDYQFAGFIDGIKLSDRVLVETTPTTTAQYTAYYSRVDYIPGQGILHKMDKVSSADRVGTFTTETSNIVFTKTESSNVVRSLPLTTTITGYALASEGYQVLDYNDVASGLTQDTATITQHTDIWATRTATIPSPGSKKVKVTPKSYGKFFISQSGTSKINNVQRIVTNAFPVNFTKGSTLQVWVSGAIAAQAKIIAVNTKAHPNTIDITDITGDFRDYIDVGELKSSIADVNEIKGYQFQNVVATTPGTFDFNLATENWTLFDENATNNLDEFARFKQHDDNDYSVRIDEIGGSSEYVVGTVISVGAGQLSFNSSYSTLQINGLIGVTKITLITNLQKIVKYSGVNFTDIAYAATFTSNYLKVNDIIYIEGNSGDGTANDYDGSFYVQEVFSSREFTFKLKGIPTDEPMDGNNGAADVVIYSKTPVLPMFYGHQYVFDMSHPSLLGYYLTFSKDNLYKLEYSFNAIERGGVPGTLSSPRPFVKLTINNEVTNISYYFDPSRIDNEPPQSSTAYLDVQDSPYLGEFVVEQLAGSTITSGAVIMKFPLKIEPEGPADTEMTKYSTSAESAVGPISDIRIVNGGGFYKKLPIISGIQSSRKIERVEINEPGTEYELGTYYSVPILGDGEGGFVQITVEDGLDQEGAPIPGQITQVFVTSPGKGYTNAYIDVESIPGILGANLEGSGADLQVIIPSAGYGASIFVQGTNVGKIKKLKNNNFGFDYPQDYTLRPEISFPVNLQLINTSILESIKVTDPGSGYSQAPTVIIEGGGGSGATAIANIKNGRIESIEVKNPGSGYSTEPEISLNSAFSYVINLDLNLLQFTYPHGIQNGSEVKVIVEDNGEGNPQLPITIFGNLVPGQTYYAIAGLTNGLETDQLRLALTPDNAELGDYLAFVNAGQGKQVLLTSSFGGKAEAIITIGQFLAGEKIYQGDSLADATAFGYVSENSGWQPGPKILKIVDYDGVFEVGQDVTGIISKAAGTIDNIKVARGVLNISPITKTPGKFIDDTGKPSEIIQKIQDSYYYQNFSYSVKSSVSIDKWRDIVTNNVHPAGFKIFGELGLTEVASIENKEVDFELIKSVNLTDAAVVPNIQNYTLVEPIYTDFTNTEVLFRQKKLTSSEQILSSVVQRLDDISNLFDGVRYSFPLTVNQEQIIANTSQLMVVMNGVVQTPGQAYQVQGDQLVFAEPPSPPASVKYVEATLDFKKVYTLDLDNVQGTYPPIGYQLTGVATGNTAIVVGSGVNSIDIFYPGESETQTISQSSRFRVGVVNTISPIINPGNNYVDENNISTTGGTGTGLTVNVSVNAQGQITTISINNGGSNYTAGDVITVDHGDGTATFNILVIQGEEIRNSATGFSAFVDSSIAIVNENLFRYQENISDFSGDTAVIESINLENKNTTPISSLQLAISASATFAFLLDVEDEDGNPLFEIDKEYQIDAEIVKVQDIDYDDKKLTILRGQLGTAVVSHASATKVYSTEIIRTNKVLLSKTAGTYQSTPGLFDIQTDEYIISASSKIIAQVTSTTPYKDPVTNVTVPQLNISDGSSFFGLLFNRLVSPELPNVILDDLATSQIQVTSVYEPYESINDKFPNNEIIRNTYITYNPGLITGTGFEIGEDIRNFRINFGGQTSEFITNEDVAVNKLAFMNPEGDLVQAGQIIYTTGATAEVVGANYGRKWLYLGKQARVGTELHKPVFYGNSKLSTIQKKFGSTSLYLDGTGDYLEITHPTEFDFTNYTIESWIYLPSVPASTYTMLFSTTGLNAYWGLRNSGGTLYLTNYDGVSINEQSSGVTVQSGQWTHVAWSRNGTIVKSFVNGEEVHSGTSSAYPNATGLKIGYSSNYVNQYYFSGYMDEVRVSNVARYTETFVAQNGIFQGDANTVLLLHMDGENNATTVHDWSGAPSYNFGDQWINNDVGFRYYDAADLIDTNADIIVDEAVSYFQNIGAGETANFTFPNGVSAYKSDFKQALTAITKSLRNGGNSFVWDAASGYREVDEDDNVSLAHITSAEIPASLYMMRLVEDMAILTMRNQFGTDNIYNNAGNYKYNQWNAVDNIYIDASNEIENNINYIAYEALYRATQQFPASSATFTDECADDIIDTLKSLVFNLRYGGNNHMWESGWWLINGGSLGHLTTYKTETIWTMNTARDLAIEIMRGLPSSKQGSHQYTVTLDTTITIDPANPRCATVASAIVSLFAIVTDSLNDPTGAAPGTYPASVATLTESGRTRPKKWPILYSTNYSNYDVFIDNAVLLDPTASKNSQYYCANVATAIQDYFNIITTTIAQADSGIDYLDTFTKVTPDYMYGGGLVSGYISIPLVAGTVDNVNDYIVTYEIGESSRNRFYDAANLIVDNANVILDETIGRMLDKYPGLSQIMPRNQGGASDAGTTRCRTDLTLILNAVADDLRDGGNLNTVQGVKFYIDSNGGIQHIRLQLLFSLFAHEQLAQLMQDAIAGELVTEYSTGIVTPPIGITDDPDGNDIQSFTPTNATYDGATGEFVATIGAHSLEVGQYVMIDEESIIMSCASDGNVKEIAYPRIGDPFYQKYVRIDNVGANTITLNVGAAPEVLYDVSFAYYDPTSGNAILNIGSHSLKEGTGVKLAAESIGFTCSSDNHATTHFYPRPGDGNYDMSHEIINVTENTIEINVGMSPDYEHRFVSALSGAVVAGGDYSHTFVSAETNSIKTAGRCADVKAAIYSLIDNMNRILAPTSARYFDACNQIWLNRDYIAEEAVGALDAEFTYSVDGVNYKAFQYPGGNTDGRNKCIRDMKFVLDCVITDLLTGGNANTVQALESYIDSNRRVLYIEDQLLATVWCLEYMKYLAHKAINNYLQSFGQVAHTTNHYVAQYTTEAPYVDNTITHDISDPTGYYSPNDCVDVHSALESLMELPGEFFTSAGKPARAAMTQLLFNTNYYKQEIAQTVKTQWDVNAYDPAYDTLIDTLTHDIVYDTLLTPKDSKYDATEKDYRAAFALKTNRLFIANEVISRFKTDNPTATFVGGDSTGVTAVLKIVDTFTSQIVNGGNWEIVSLAKTYVSSTNAIISAGLPFAGNAAYSLQLIGYAYALSVLAIREQHIVPTGTHGYTQVHNYDTDYDARYDEDYLSDITDLGSLVSSIMEERIGYGGTLKAQSTALTVYYNILHGTVNKTITTPGSTTPFYSGVEESTALQTTYNNTETLETLRTLPYLLNNEGSSPNILESTIWGQINEDFNLPSYQTPGGWYRYGGTISGVQYTAPDGTQTADKWIPGVNNIDKVIYYNYPLTTYSTYDGVGITYDSNNATFDTGAEGSVQKFTYSCFFKASGYGQTRFEISWGRIGLNGFASNYSYAFFNFNLLTGTKSNNFIQNINTHAMGVIPYGNGWYRCYITFDIPYGIAEFRASNYMAQTLINGAGNGTDGLLIWGAKLNAGNLDAYEANTNGKRFYSNNDYNKRLFILDELQKYYAQALNKNLVSPAPLSSFQAYYKTNLVNYDATDYTPIINSIINHYKAQMEDDTYYESMTQISTLKTLDKVYVKPNARVIQTPLSGALLPNEYMYGMLSDSSAETKAIFSNKATVAKHLVRLRYAFVEQDQNLITAYSIGMQVTDINEVDTTGTIYAMYEDVNYKYIDIIDEGTVPWTVGVNFIDMTNSEEAEVASVEYRMVLVRPEGQFNASQAFKGYSSGTTGIITQYYNNSAAVIDNTGGKLTIDTESITGSFEKTSVVYADESQYYINAYKHAGSGDITLNDKLISAGYVTLEVTVYEDTFNNVTRDNFYLGANAYSIIDNVPVSGISAIVSGWDVDNSTLYLSMISGEFELGDTVAVYIGGGNPVGQGIITSKTDVESQFVGTVVSKVEFVNYERIYLTGVKGTLQNYDTILGPRGYKAAITEVVPIEGRVTRYFVGFDGVQTNFKLTINNGTPYFPDPAGHMLIFVNGVLQPPGGTNAYSAFSDEIEFTEAPEANSSFTGYYVGKLRYLNDIGYEFDSLRSSFNILYDDAFYSLTLTDGVNADGAIRPENNIIISLNGVIQEPGIGFQLIGSRVLFSEIPRFGSTFVAFSYIGSEADVVAATVVPPLESGDKLTIQGETEDRTIAVIESSNSLVTFDYLGSIFGRDAKATATITKGRLLNAQVTFPGNGYVSRPLVRVDSTTGFDASIKALVGVSKIEIKESGTGYGYPTISTINDIPLGYIYPDIDEYPRDGIGIVQEETVNTTPIPVNVPPQSGTNSSAADGISTLSNEADTLANQYQATVLSGFVPDYLAVNAVNSPTSFELQNTELEIITSGTPEPALFGTPLGKKMFPDLPLQVYEQNEKYNFVYRAGTNTSNPMFTGFGNIGVAVNGVVLATSFDNSATLPTTSFARPKGFYWNRVFHEDKYGVDACGGVPDQNTGEYAYRSGSFLMNCWTRAFYRSNPYFSDTNFKSNFYRHPDGHSKIIGWCSDGYPIYGPFGYTNATDSTQGVSRMKTSYRMLTKEAYGRTYDYEQLPVGSFINDFEFVYGLGTLDASNGRFCITPEYPNGTYAYFLTIDSNGNPIYPYIVGNVTRQQRPEGFNESQIHIVPYTPTILDELVDPPLPPAPLEDPYIIDNFNPLNIWASSFI